MKIKGKVINVLPVQHIAKKDGSTIDKFGFVIEVPDDKYPKKVAFTSFNADCALNNTGAEVEVDFDIDSREWQGKWFTEARAWKVTPQGGQQTPAAPTQPVFAEQSNNDSLPF